MENQKIKVAILFGGKSAEHEVSLQSAKNIFDAIDKEKYEPVMVKIDKSGQWFIEDDLIVFPPQGKGGIHNLSDSNKNLKVDIVFPILHGPFGEDGTVQGLLKLADVPFVGSSVLGSAVGMDKDLMKRLLRDSGIKIGKFIVLKELKDFQEVKNELGLPLFVKPANMGSSVGVSKVNNEDEYKEAVIKAFNFDTKVIIEENIEGREIECSVLGNDNPIASIPGEVIPKHDFYSYDAKYIDEQGAILEIPAKISDENIKKIQGLAIKTFQVLSCEGLGRVDFFVKENNEIFVNEINTIPGFTKISMYPKMWEASGIPYTELIDRLIQLAFERFKKEQELKTSY